MYKLEQISTYVKSVIAITMGELALKKLPNEDGIFCYMEKKAGYYLWRKALDLSWKWIENNNVDEIDPWNFCCYLDDTEGIDLIEYECDATKVGDKKCENIYGIMNCIILYIAYQAFEKSGEEYLPDYLQGIDDEFYAKGILDYATKIKGCNFYEILDYCDKRLKKNSNCIFNREEIWSMFLQEKRIEYRNMFLSFFGSNSNKTILK